MLIFSLSLFVDCIIRRMKQIEINWDLNPENAKSKGYIWCGDAIYDPEAPDEVKIEFVEDIKKGYFFGEPANVNIIDSGGVGVYKPIDK